MKILFILIPVLSVFSFIGQKQNKDLSRVQYQMFSGFENLYCPPAPLFTEIINGDKKQNSGDYDPDISDSWQKTVFNEIEMSEYNINYSEKMNSYQSPNRANNMRFMYHPDGFTVKPKMTKIPMFDVNDKNIMEKDKKYETIDDWSIQFQINNFKIGMTDRLVVNGNEAHIENEDIRIDYSNTKAGMRQDFIVKNKPEASGRSDGKLRLDLTADTKLNMIVGADALMFKNKGGDVMLKYSSLKCWDAKGTELRAYFEKQLQITDYNLQIESKGKDYTANNICNLKSVICNSFSIVVNDQNAVYPVTIDPLSTSPDWTAESNQALAYFGWSVSTAGDVNGDGYSDVIVGATMYVNDQNREGRAFVYHGSSSGLSLTANWTAESDQDGSEYGYSVTTAGDVNGDGYSDVIVGARWYDNGQPNEGRTFVYYGSASGLSATANWTAESDQANAEFGFSVSTLGDINGDGFSDVIVGAPYYDGNRGAVFIYHGSAAGLPAAANKMALGQTSSLFGYSVSTAGDVDGNGYSDGIVAMPSFFTGGSAAFVYRCNALGWPPGPSWQLLITHNVYTVSTAGDVNGDGYSDVIIGAKNYNSKGAAFVYHGLAFGTPATAAWIVESDQDGAEFGCSVSTAGDVNGDGYSDVIVGARLYDNGQFNEGSAFVYHGSASGLSTSASWTAESDQLFGYFGSAVSMAGDVNGDGYSDVIVGTSHYNNGQTDEGRAFVYHGSAANLSLNVFVQGFYNSGTNQTVSDTLKIYLRNGSAPYAIADSAKSVMTSDGDCNFIFANASNGVPYYIEVRHRNSIETWSKTAQQFTGNNLNYNFSSSDAAAYGDNQIQVDNTPVIYAIYSADVNQDGTIDLTDGSLIDNDAFNFASGYLPTDVNGDGVIDLADAVYADNNALNFVGKVTP